ncbi:hypothetical protein ACLOJK_006290 [Asimina triloba]
MVFRSLQKDPEANPLADPFLSAARACVDEMFAATSATVALAFPAQKKPLLHRGAFGASTRLFDEMPLLRHGSFVVCSKMRRRRRPTPQIQYNGADEGEGEDRGGVGRSILAALNPEEPPKAVEPPRSDVLRSDEESEEDSSSPSPSLRGSDVLLALQRAAAQKLRRGRKETKGRPSRDGKSEDGFEDLSNARPIEIRSDWVARLDEIERKLEELIKLEEHSA